MAAAREEDVTRGVAVWLVDLRWRVVSVHFPGTQGGLRIRPDVRGAKSTGAIVPDVVAVRMGYLLLCESKPEFYLADAHKLLAVTADDRYVESLRRTCALTGQPLRALLPAVCFGGPPPIAQPAGIVLLRHCPAGIEALNVPIECQHLFG